MYIAFKKARKIKTNLKQTIMGPFEIIMLIMGAIGAIASTVGQAQINKENLEQTEENREDSQAFNAEQAQLAHQREIEKYNLLYSPSAKVQQLKDAGLSVGLMYGNGAGISGTSTTGSQAASASSAQIPLMNPMANLGNIADTMMNVRDSQLKESQTAKTNEEVKEIGQKIAESQANIKLIESRCNTEICTQNNLELDGKLKELDIKFNEATLNDRISIVNEELTAIRTNCRKTLEEIEGLKIDNKNKQELYNAQLRLMGEQTELIIKQKLLTQAETAKAWAERELAKAKTETEKQMYNKVYQESQNLMQVGANLIQDWYIKEGEITNLEKQGKVLDEEARKKQKEADFVWLDKVNETISTAASAFEDVVGTVMTRGGNTVIKNVKETKYTTINNKK